LGGRRGGKATRVLYTKQRALTFMAPTLRADMFISQNKHIEFVRLCGRCREDLLDVSIKPSILLPLRGVKMSADASSVTPENPGKSTSSAVSVRDGTISVNGASISSTVKAVLGVADEIGGFWSRWGVSVSLLIIGTFVILIAFAAHLASGKRLDDDSFFGALAFALVILALGYVAFMDRQNRAKGTDRQSVEIYRLTVEASIRGQEIGVEERRAAMPRAQGDSAASATGKPPVGG
jgi:hypothetical protein